MERSGRGLILGSIPVFTWRGLRKATKNISVNSQTKAERSEPGTSRIRSRSTNSSVEQTDEQHVRSAGAVILTLRSVYNCHYLESTVLARRHPVLRGWWRFSPLTSHQYA
jgi:hypothetical protein